MREHTEITLDLDYPRQTLFAIAPRQKVAGLSSWGIPMSRDILSIATHVRRSMQPETKYQVLHDRFVHDRFGLVWRAGYRRKCRQPVYFRFLVLLLDVGSRNLSHQL